MKKKNFKYSKNWKQWITAISMYTCSYCAANNGKIFAINQLVDKIPVHPNCHCHFAKVLAISAGDATNDGKNGADWYLKYLGMLPDYYITKKEARELGWKPALGNLDEVAPGCMIFGGIFDNDKGYLPQQPGRIWYEADINYENSWRNNERVLFSNDGLVFVSYDHYKTFIEVIE